MTIRKLDGENSKLFEPLTIANGKVNLSHRVIHAPMTRNRGVPVNANSTPENPNRLWYPGDLMVEYYRQRATPGGLIITEGIPPSLEVSLSLTLCGCIFWELGTLSVFPPRLKHVPNLGLIYFPDLCFGHSSSLWFPGCQDVHLVPSASNFVVSI